MHDFTFRWNRNEHARAIQAIARHMPGRKWINIFLYSGYTLIIALLLYRPQVSPPFVVFVLFGFLMFLLAYAVWLEPWLRAREVSREDTSVNQDIRHIVADDALRIRTHSVTTDMKWELFKQVVETPEFFLFYVSRRSAVFTPKRAIPPEDLDPLRTSLRSYLGTRARLSSSTKAAA